MQCLRDPCPARQARVLSGSSPDSHKFPFMSLRFHLSVPFTNAFEPFLPTRPHGWAPKGQVMPDIKESPEPLPSTLTTKHQRCESDAEGAVAAPEPTASSAASRLALCGVSQARPSAHLCVGASA